LKILPKKSNEKSLAKSNAETYSQCSINVELSTIAERLNDTSWTN
jgi:hypothetical protein